MGNGMKANITSSHTYNLSDTFTKAPTSMKKKKQNQESNEIYQIYANILLSKVINPSSTQKHVEKRKTQKKKLPFPRFFSRDSCRH